MNVAPSKKIVAHLILLDGNFHSLVCKTVHVPPGPKKVGSSHCCKAHSSPTWTQEIWGSNAHWYDMDLPKWFVLHVLHVFWMENLIC